MEDKVIKNFNIKDILQIILFLTLLVIPTYFAYKVLLPKEVEIISNLSKDAEETDKSSKRSAVEEPIEQQSEQAEEGPHYTEDFIEIGGQMSYIAVPTTMEEPATIVIYSHGSNTLVTTNTEDPFIQDLQAYGELFTNENLIFAASNEHGENWGNSDSIQDIFNLVEYLKNNYNVNDQIYMIGFSMGGLPTMHYTQEYPKTVSKIALLAPTTRKYEWNVDNVRDILDIDIEIWHGTADVNIGIIYTDNFVSYLKDLGKTIPVNRLEGKTHFDVDAEYMDEILDFFMN